MEPNAMIERKINVSGSLGKHVCWWAAVGEFVAPEESSCSSPQLLLAVFYLPVLSEAAGSGRHRTCVLLLTSHYPHLFPALSSLDNSSLTFSLLLYLFCIWCLPSPKSAQLSFLQLVKSHPLCSSVLTSCLLPLTSCLSRPSISLVSALLSNLFCYPIDFFPWTILHSSLRAEPSITPNHSLIFLFFSQEY